jgi:NAD(P) transhydrogenase subunit beta
MPLKLIDLGIVVVLLVGISWFRNPRGARWGNRVAALAVGAAILVVLRRYPIQTIGIPLLGVAAGTVIGFGLARRVRMVHIPAMVAIQNGMGGMASFLVSFVELTRSTNQAMSGISEFSALLGIVVGTATFSGSMVAGGKLANWIRQTAVAFRRHNGVLIALVALATLLIVAGFWTGEPVVVRVVAASLILVAGALGLVFSIRVGGADMPVLISFLNAGSGVAAALCGLAMVNWLLIACGALVGVSGTILTMVMCRAMNRDLASIFAGRHKAVLPASPSDVLPVAGETPGVPGEPSVPSPGVSDAPVGPPPGLLPAGDGRAHEDPFARAVAAMKGAQRVIIVPGYGMALADAQEEVVQLGDKLVEMGKELLFAIHPVAGRMPGHMHVLLAEADVDYGRIRELKDVNPEFARTDLALIVGACDVVNPAAMEVSGTPISGMPILRAHEARQVVVCNLDERPGYSGVDNPLYQDPRTILLLGDAKATVSRLLEQLS